MLIVDCESRKVGRVFRRRGAFGHGERHIVPGDTLSETNPLGFELESFERRLLFSADFAPVDARLDAPYERDSYTFELTGDREFILDVRGAPDDARWSLDGPGDTAGGLLSDSDPGERAEPLLDLGPGAYTLTVAAGEATGAYGFRLLDLSNGDPAAVGDTLSGSLESGDEVDIFTLSAVEGDRLFFEGLNVAGGRLEVTLLDPDGTKTALDARGVGTISGPLKATGDYALVVEDLEGGTEAIDYDVVVGRVDETVRAISPFDRIDGTGPGFASINVYTFSLDASVVVAPDFISGSFRSLVSLEGPDGTVLDRVSLSSLEAAGPLNLSAGDWRLTVEEGTGIDYALRLVSA